MMGGKSSGVPAGSRQHKQLGGDCNIVTKQRDHQNREHEASTPRRWREGTHLVLDALVHAVRQQQPHAFELVATDGRVQRCPTSLRAAARDAFSDRKGRHGKHVQRSSREHLLRNAHATQRAATPVARRWRR